MHFDFTDTQLQTFCLRILHSLFILLVAIELYRSASQVDNVRLTRIFWKASLFAGSFFLFRILAGIADNAVAFDVGWFSNIVNVIYWGVIVWKARTVRLILSSPRNSEVRIALRDDIDELLSNLTTMRTNLHKMR